MCICAVFQDVMLSGTSTQSPVSSVLTMPAVSMSQGATSHTLLGSGHGGLPDNLFLGMHGVTSNDVDSKDLAGEWRTAAAIVVLYIISWLEI